VVEIGCNDCCEGINYEEEGVITKVLSSVHTESTLELEYLIGVDKEKVIQTELKAPNCRNAIVTEVP
jgi:hypothetical protein